MFADQFEMTSLADVLGLFRQQCVVSEHYFLSNLTDMYHTASLLRHLPLTLHQQYVFAMSPVDSKNLEQASEFLRYCTAFAFHDSVSVRCGALVRQLPRVQQPKNEAQRNKPCLECDISVCRRICNDWKTFMAYWISISG